MTDFTYFSEIPAAVTVCDADGIILYMNKKSIATFQKDGGAALIGKSMLDCHSGESREKVDRLLHAHEVNTYTIEKNGVHKMIYQTPWFKEGIFQGLIEFSFEIPAEVPHYLRKEE